MHSLGRMLEAACRRSGNDPFVVSMDAADGAIVQVSYREFLSGVCEWSAVLRRRGVGTGDRVAIVSPKSPLQVQAFYACWWLGAIAVPICESLGAQEMGFIVHDSDPVLLLVDRAFLSTISPVCGERPSVVLQDLPAADSGVGVPVVSPVEYQDDDIAALIYTSGSTGMPKGVMLTHRNLHTNALSVREAYRFDRTDRIMSLLPYWHSYALVCEVIAAPLCGAQTAIPRDKRDFSRNIGRYAPTVVLLVPRIAAALKASILRGILESSRGVRWLGHRALANAARVVSVDHRSRPLSLRLLMDRLFFRPLVFGRLHKRFGGRLRFFVSGGAPLDLEHQLFFKSLGLTIYQGYGLTESSPVISANLPEQHRLGSSGPLLSWLQPDRGGDYVFRDEHGRVGRQVRGELLVKGDCVMKGYWRHADVSAKTLHEGWLHTGDMGYVDGDGFLYLEGRQGNMIVLVGGEKVHPEHVEDAVKAADIITDAMVIGEACKHIYVLVNVDPEAVSGLNEAEIQRRTYEALRAATSHLAPFQRPKGVLILPDFSADDGTLTATMKVRRYRVWERHGAEIRDFLTAHGEATSSLPMATAGG